VWRPDWFSVIHVGARIRPLHRTLVGVVGWLGIKSKTGNSSCVEAERIEGSEAASAFWHGGCLQSAQSPPSAIFLQGRGKCPLPDPGSLPIGSVGPLWP
jgi:hypothetical protein